MCVFIVGGCKCLQNARSASRSTVRASHYSLRTTKEPRRFSGAPKTTWHARYLHPPPSVPIVQRRKRRATLHLKGFFSRVFFCCCFSVLSYMWPACELCGIEGACSLCNFLLSHERRGCYAPADVFIPWPNIFLRQRKYVPFPSIHGHFAVTVCACGYSFPTASGEGCESAVPQKEETGQPRVMFYFLIFFTPFAVSRSGTRWADSPVGFLEQPALSPWYTCALL